MGLCSKSKTQRVPLKPRVGPYKNTNAYTHRFSIEQVITFLLALSVVVLHSIFVVKPLTKIDHPILYILLGIHYLLLAGLIVTYVQITVFDPVDSFILWPELVLKEQDKNNPTFCNLCRSNVHEKSYHCKRCNRCTENFDHHCVFLNNCIGSLNYELFMRLLLFYLSFLFITIAQCIWVFVQARQDIEVQESAISEWLSVVIIILCGLQIIATGALLTFHCYISCCLDLTTIAFYQSESDSVVTDDDRRRLGTNERVTNGLVHRNDSNKEMYAQDV